LDPNFISVEIDSIRVSLVSPHRIVVLKDKQDRFLPIWVGPFEADAIRVALEGNQVARPLTHDLFKNLINTVGGKAIKIVINDLREDTFFASIQFEVDGRPIELDARPSDAIALAIRVAGTEILVDAKVMKQASIRPSQSIESTPEAEEKLDAFADLIEDLDLDGLDKPTKEN
jgi:uncharacterized protein